MVVFHEMPVGSKEAFEANVDRLFDDAIRGSSAWEPKCNVYEDDGRFCVQMAVPGLSVNQLNAQIEGDTLRVKGERKCQGSEGTTWYVRELEEGTFTCAFQLPAHVDRDAVHASYEQGMLTITCPKREEAKPRQVEIQSPGAPLMIEDETEGRMNRSIKAASLLFSGLIGLGIWSAWNALLT
ncbi:MAG TPA: Hsp20/alpha crystallin family protein [Nitrospiraceae bacterium]|nr:Hsp20/alpha crystallin family protein [Nitrospiraceae bacterium]